MLSTFPSFFFFNDTATTEIYTLSLHDALPISARLHEPLGPSLAGVPVGGGGDFCVCLRSRHDEDARSEEHTSELQSRLHLVCRLLLEKKKKDKGRISAAIYQIEIQAL